MAHTLKIAADASLAMIWPFGRNAPVAPSRPATATQGHSLIFNRPCPICGHETHQRVVERGHGYITYWCAECTIPHDVELAKDGFSSTSTLESWTASEDEAGDQMEINDLIRPQSVLTGMRPGSKREMLTLLAREAASRTGEAEQVVFDALEEREHLGSTGVGAGIAVPHARLPGLDRLCAVFVRLDRPIDFEAVDERPVDLIFLLLSPETAGVEHLRMLSRISRLLRDGEVCRKLRGATDPAALRSLLIERFKAAA